MEDLYVIAGLGNPGNRYDNTRHNVGFEAIDYLASKHNISLTKLKFKALYGEGYIEGKRVLLVKPQTFMNLSGESLRDILDWYKLPVNNLIVLYDDIDLDTGKLRIRPKGSAGSHNGMKSIIYQLQKDSFPRVRLGIGKPPVGWDLADFVLSKFSADDRKLINDCVIRSAEAISLFLKSGIDSAMNTFNK